MRSRRSRTASTSSWSTSRPMRSPGPLLARKAKAAGVVYSLAWGDQPALICEHVDWARTCGFKVIAAGKGTRYEPHYHQSTPDTLWDILDKYLQIDDRDSINPKMFNSFVDGTKSGIEMTAVCNATGLVPQSERPRLSAGDAVRTRRRLQAEGRRRHAGEGGRHRGGVVGRSRRPRRAASSRARHLCGVRGRERLRAPLLQGIRHAAGQQRALRRALPADPHDRARARRLGRERGAAPRADRRADRLPLRRGRDRQARAQARRDARRRGRLLRLGQADAGGALAGATGCCRSGSPARSSSRATSRRARRCAGATWRTTKPISP